jgi:hypothetical protein
MLLFLGLAFVHYEITTKVLEKGDVILSND